MRVRIVRGPVNGWVLCWLLRRHAPAVLKVKYGYLYWTCRRCKEML